MPRWPLRKTPFWAEAPLFHILLPLLLAAVIYDSGILKASNLWGVVSGCCVCLLLILAVINRRAVRFVKPVFIITIYTAVFFFGLWRAQSVDVRNDRHWFALKLDTVQGSLVKILDEPQEKERIWRMRVSVLKNAGDPIKSTIGEAFLNIYKSDSVFHYHQGDVVLVPARWQKISNSSNPFEVDYMTANRRRNICHQQFVSADEVVLFRKDVDRPDGLLTRIHSYCDAQLNKYVTDSATHGLLEAMLLGDESTFDPGLRQAYSETGVIHIVSISGSHVGVLFAAIAFLLSGIRGRAGSWIRLAVGVTVIWCYVLMAGAPPSAIRAALMFSIIGAGTVLSREAHPLNTLFAAAIALLCANPAWLFSVGFQLSFGAVLSLIIFYQPIRSLWPQSNKALRLIWNGIAASLAAEMLTAPLVIYYFHNFPLFFLVANLLAAFLVGLVALLGGMLIIVCSPLPWLAGFVTAVVTWTVKAFNAVIVLLQSWNPISFRYLQISGQELVLLYLAITGISVWLMKKAKPALYLGLASTILLLFLLCSDKIAVMRQDRLVVYNISRHHVVERIKDNHYEAAAADTAKSVLFTVKQAHTGWAAWKPSFTKLPECFFLKGKKILILNSGLRNDSTIHFPVDILVISCPLKYLDPQLLQRTFHPKIVVAGSDQPRWLIRKWKEDCTRSGIPFHATGIDGAFTLE